MELGEGFLGGGPLLAGEFSDPALQDDQIHDVLDEGAVVLIEAVDLLEFLEQVKVGDRGLRGAVGGELGEVVEGDVEGLGHGDEDLAGGDLGEDALLEELYRSFAAEAAEEDEDEG